MSGVMRGLCEGEEELLHLLLVHRLIRVGQALLKAGGDDGETGAVQRLAHGGELGDHILALSTLLQHAHHGGQLSLGALEAVDHRFDLGGFEFHGGLLKQTSDVPSP
ncbi:hypothetical protein [Corynebacterium efficiens YS-314]|uniref:Uncharacterized protein n=1 Tax=Corynebacterium efficiens (strain DSM 44549 / YS-314 / AJ 12310 / JCM 11189 / NBRC 100395) TaxID=196164 RepID=Q8FUG4_COREF|nr:hypothetical protein [Corynebacterium efficiens YS-314]